jgi:prevent-host-death family protein
MSEQGGIGDSFVMRGAVEELGELLEDMKATGLPSGIGSHSIETTKAVAANHRTGLTFRNEIGYFSFMKRASVTYAKNHLSRLLDGVRRGESVLITDRNVVVAELVPVSAEGAGSDERLSALIREGLVSPPKRKLKVAEFLARPRPRLEAPASLVRAVLEDREESR